MIMSATLSDASPQRGRPAEGELLESRAARILGRLYPHLRGRWRHALGRRIARLEGGEMLSATLRRLFAAHHQVEIGAHSYGCFDPDRFGPALRIGRYVSIGPGVRVFRRNHPLDRISMHPYFYGRSLGADAHATLPAVPLTIADDSWIGANALILPGCRSIGIGAVIGAGSVVTKDVPAFAIVAGNPARLLRYRFSQAMQQRIAESAWWRRDPAALLALMPYLQTPANEQAIGYFASEINRA